MYLANRIADLTKEEYGKSLQVLRANLEKIERK